MSLTPSYAGSVGVGWLERGGVKAIANIRGGGEYGPRWHQAALKQDRNKAYEDFEAVAKDLIARGVTSAPKLGCQGGSNGGLLTGNMLARPTAGASLFGAIVCQVPLLDSACYLSTQGPGMATPRPDPPATPHGPASGGAPGCACARLRMRQG